MALFFMVRASNGTDYIVIVYRYENRHCFETIVDRIRYGVFVRTLRVLIFEGRERLAHAVDNYIGVSRCRSADGEVAHGIGACGRAGMGAVPLSISHKI